MPIRSLLRLQTYIQRWVRAWRQRVTIFFRGAVAAHMFNYANIECLTLRETHSSTAKFIQTSDSCSASGECITLRVLTMELFVYNVGNVKSFSVVMCLHARTSN